MILKKHTQAQVFISYSHKDEESRKYVEEHFSVFSKQNKLSFWSDKEIEPGEEWSPVITKELDRASVAVLLLSRHFLSSDFIMDKEVPLFLEKREKGELEILFLMLSPCAWQEVEWIEKLQGFPRNNYPLSGMNRHEQDEVLVQFSMKVREKCKIQENKHTASSPEIEKVFNSPFSVPFEAKKDGAIGVEKKLIELDKILNQTIETNTPKIVTIQGIGGLGKTQLAVEYAHKYKNKYNGVIWLTMDQNIDDQLIDIAISSGWVDRDVDAKVKLNIARDSYIQLNHMLLIYDNVEKYEEVELYLPKASNNSVIITTRNIIQGFPVVSLDILDEKNSLELLRSESKKEIGQNEFKSAIKLVQILDGLPLALEMAAGLVYSLELNWNDYWENFKEEGVSFLNESDIRGATKHESNISKTLSMSEKLLDDNPILELIMNLLAWGALEPISKELISKMLGINKAKLAISIQKGIKLKFIKEEQVEEQVLYTLHRLVGEVWKKQHKLDSVYINSIAKNLASYMKEIKSDFINKRELDMASFQAHKWSEYLEDNAQVKAKLICYAAYSDSYLGNYTKALSYINYAYSIVKQDIDSLIHLELLNFKASLLRSLGNSKKAVSYYGQALKIGKKLYPDTDHLDVVYALSGMGSSLKSLGKYTKAQFYYDDALEMTQRLYCNKDHPALAYALRNKYVMPNSLDDFQNAQPYYKEALEMRQRLYPDKDHPDLADSLSVIGFMFKSLGEIKKAEPYYAQALNMIERLYPDTDHPYTARALNNLGSIYNSLGDLNEAKFYYRQALDMRTKLYSSMDHPDVANSLNNMGSILNYLGDLKAAKFYYDRSLKMRQKIYHETDHPHVASSFNNMGFILDSLGDAKAAEPYYRKALEMRQRLYPGMNNTDIANSLSGMGSVLLSLNDLKGARTYYEEALKMLEVLYPNIDHPEIAAYLSNVAFIVNSMGDTKEAQEYYDKALKMRQRLYPNMDHVDIADSLSDLGFIINSLGNVKSAEPYYKQALEMRQRLYSDLDHLDIANSLNNMAMLYKKLKKYEESRKFILEAIDIMIRLDYDPERLKACQDNLRKIEDSIKQN